MDKQVVVPAAELQELCRAVQAVGSEGSAVVARAVKLAQTLGLLAQDVLRAGPASSADMAVYQSIADGYTRDTAPAPAEVPMPEPDTHCYDEDERRDVWSHSADQMRTYGAACRAAGYALGLAEAGRDAERYRTVRFLATAERDPLPDYEGDTSSPDAFDASIDHATVALRGEVKP